jgi:hypothetical protein
MENGTPIGETELEEQRRKNLVLEKEKKEKRRT